MATLSTQVITRAGLSNPTFASCAGGGDRFTPDRDTTLHVKNGSGGALTVTVAPTRTFKPNQSIASIAVSVPAGGEVRLGPYPYEDYAAVDGSGLADVTYSGVTSLTIAVIKTQQP